MQFAADFLHGKKQDDPAFLTISGDGVSLAQNTDHSKNTAGLPACARMLRHAARTPSQKKFPMAYCPDQKRLR